MSVCVIDDNADIRDSLCTVVELLECRCTTFADAESALREFASVAPDHTLYRLAFVDVSMPGMSGYDFVKALRAQQHESSLPFLVAMTGWGGERDREAALSAGFHAHLTKPAELAEIRTMIARASARGA